MQLKKIKLAGFKSFVDPTTVLLPSNLVAIVGPNGCGKSNIIDAICWVMGESSAKQLRGELLTDVIFNGSSSRKPIGQASVELLFDNQDGSLRGEYGNYAEISIKRIISRDGDAHYLLNGTRCRRRDIIDIFLGTGLGPRSYSIIGQNMISRLIEAKPEEMRVYLEEAAGVSKYKERRRETENRIHHAKENLERVNDLRIELDRQLQTLKRQSTAAEKYKLLRQEERTLKAQWHAIQWRQWDGQAVSQSLLIQQQETGLEARQTDLVSLTRKLENQRSEQRLANEYFQEVQQRFYMIGNDITRMEQDLHHHQERRNQLQNDSEQIAKDHHELSDQLAEHRDNLEELTEEILQLQPETQNATDASRAAIQDLKQAEEIVQNWQAQWDEFNVQNAQATQTAEVQQTRIQHLEQTIGTSKHRQAQLQQEQSQLNFSHLENEIGELSDVVLELNESSATQDFELQAIRNNLNQLRHNETKCNADIDKVRNEIQQLNGQQSSLEALQETALGQRNNQTSQWLSQYQLDKHPRLAQSVEVEAGWENAVEKFIRARQGS